MKVSSIVLLVASLACSRAPEEPTSQHEASASKAAKCPKDPEPGRAKAPVVDLFAKEGAVRLRAEFVWRSEDTARGLMYRTSMALDEGMLFKLPRRVQEFWMHNTCMSLDMLFLDDDGTILGILDHVPILNDEPRSVGKPGSYVLELTAGAAAHHGLVAGLRIDLPASVRQQYLTEMDP